MNQASFNDVEGLFGSMGQSPDGIGSPMGRYLGEATLEKQETVDRRPISVLKAAYAIAGLAGTAIGAYHGYKRNDSVGWAIGWALLGGLFPVIVIPVAFAQGIGKRDR